MDLREASLGFYRVHLAALGFRHGMFAALATRARTPDDLADEKGLDAPVVAKWCRAAHAVGLLERTTRGAYKVPRVLVPKLARDDDPASLGRHFQYLAAKGRTFDRIDGMLHGEWDAPDLADVYALATGWDHVAFFDLVLPRERALQALLRRGARVLDLGAGDGAWAKSAASRFPASAFVAAEVPDALPALRKSVKGTRVEAVAVGDIPDGGFDIAYLGEVLSAATTPLDPLRRAFASLAPGGRLHALEGLLPPTTREPRGWGERLILAMDLDFGLDGSRFLRRDEATAAMRGAGFVRARVRDVGGSLFHLAATKPKR